jgi:GDP-L-fucose synthase
VKAVVLGASGFIGGALAKSLAARGIPARLLGGRGVVDLRHALSCAQAVAGMDIVFMCAGVTGGAGLISADPLSLVTPNVIMHLQLFEACAKAGVERVVCLSSTTGYPDTELPMVEEDYFRGEPHPAYFNPGHARRFIERLGEMHKELDIVFLRPSMVYGPGDNFDLANSHVIPALVRKIAERQNPITVWGDGSTWRDGVYIDDVARALILAADAPPGAYNIGCGEGMTVTQMLVHLQAASGHHPNIEYDATKPAMLKKRVLDIEKAKRVLGWEPSILMGQGLSRTLEWYESL